MPQTSEVAKLKTKVQEELKQARAASANAKKIRGQNRGAFRSKSGDNLIALMEKRQQRHTQRARDWNQLIK